MNPLRTRGLALFVGTIVAIVLAVAIGSNVLFDRETGADRAVATASAPAAAPGGRVLPAPAAEPAEPAAPAAAPGAAVAPPPPTTRTAAEVPPPETAPSVSGDPAQPVRFVPPTASDLPEGEFGDVVRQGERIFMETGRYAPQFVGNRLNCVNCHLDAGRKPGSAPLWAAFVHYPAYRKKTGDVSTYAARLQGCFMYSMNGKAPPADHEVITALTAYSFWLAQGAPVGRPVAGGGYAKLPRPAQAPDYARGEQVYAQQCALCHGADGQGQRVGDTQVFPPLWGPQSFNWGAGMHQLGNAAAFIHANMPLGKGGSLTEQQAWDVAAFMNSHERPQDPRYTGSVADTRKQYHDSDDSLYGTTVNGHLLGSGT